MDAGELSPGHLTSDLGDLHLANPAGLRYQGTEYTILDESAPEQALCLSQGDPILELVSYPEGLQLTLSRRFGEFIPFGSMCLVNLRWFFVRSALYNRSSSLSGHQLTL